MTIDLDFVLMCDDMIEGGSEVEKSNNKQNPIVIVQEIIIFFTSHSTLQIWPLFEFHIFFLIFRFNYF